MEDRSIRALSIQEPLRGTDTAPPSSSRHTSSSAPVNKFTTTKVVEYRAAVIGGCLLSINAGYINAISVLEFSVSCPQDDRELFLIFNYLFYSTFQNA